MTVNGTGLLFKFLFYFCLCWVLVAGFLYLWQVGATLAAACRLLTEVASPVAALRLQSAGLAAVAHGLSCPTACGILPDQGLNPYCRMCQNPLPF